QYLVEDAENRRVRPDPERERQDRHEAEDRLLTERAERVANVLHTWLRRSEKRSWLFPGVRGSRNRNLRNSSVPFEGPCARRCGSIGGPRIAEELTRDRSPSHSQTPGARMRTDLGRLGSRQYPGRIHHARRRCSPVAGGNGCTKPDAEPARA